MFTRALGGRLANASTNVKGGIIGKLDAADLEVCRFITLRAQEHPFLPE
ncbi:MAG: hypothetical protein ACF788_12555 [Novipirellula sp. JB048]